MYPAAFAVHRPAGTPGRVGTTIAALLAIAPAVLLVYNAAPSATFFNQAAAFVGWGVFVIALMRHDSVRQEGNGRTAAGRWWSATDSGARGVWAALALLILAASVSPFTTGLPTAMALSAVGTLAGAGICFQAGLRMPRGGWAGEAFGAFCLAIVAAGSVSAAIGIVQVHLPEWSGNAWIAAIGDTRAAGNLRQANHLGTLLLWSCVALAWLVHAKWLGRWIGATLAAVAVFGLVLTASRTATLGVIALGVWGVLDRRLARGVRAGLMGVPVLYAIAFWLLNQGPAAGETAFAGASRFSTEGDISNSRFAIWSNALALVARHPWFGIGWGEFNLAWTLTPFPNRPIEFFDNAHNLPLQLAAELGLPMALAVLALLVHALWRAFAASRSGAGEEAALRRCAFMMVLLVGIHSMLEYPLWYAYFLLPTVFAWGLALGRRASATVMATDTPGSPRRLRVERKLLLAGGLLLAAGGVLAVLDYQRVARVFAPDAATPLAQRIEDGKGSWFFAHHAHYAAATVAEPAVAPLASFDMAKHYLLDARLMMAWANALHARGDDERALYLAARLREFRNGEAGDFFAPCEPPAAASGASQPVRPPFPCAAPSQALEFGDFR